MKFDEKCDVTTENTNSQRQLEMRLHISDEKLEKASDAVGGAPPYYNAIHV